MNSIQRIRVCLFLIYFYTYNGETITAVLKQGTPATITFPESTIKGYTYYIALTSKETGNVMYIPYGGWKEINKEETDPNTLNGVHYWDDIEMIGELSGHGE